MTRTQANSTDQRSNTSVAVLQDECTCSSSSDGSGKCSKCAAEEKKEAVQRWAMRSGPVATVPSVVHDVLREPGQPLDAGSRSYFEPRFGADFGNVRIH